MKTLRTLGILTVVVVVFAWAHEGHKAITTKGVKFTKDGKLTLLELNRIAVDMKTAKVEIRPMEESVELVARAVVPWSRRGFATSRLSGVVSAVHARPGQTVRGGQILAEIESLELESLQQALLDALLRLELAKENLDRVRRLGEEIVTGTEIYRLEAEFEEAQNAVVGAESELRIVGLEEKQIAGLRQSSERVPRLPVTAPMDGAVVHMDVLVGQHVEPNEHLFEISDPSKLWIQGDLPETLAGRVAVGMEARFVPQAFPGRSWNGRVDRIGGRIEAEDRHVEIWMQTENADLALKEGMFGLFRIVTGRDEVFAVPDTAVVEDGAERYVFVQEKPGVYRRANLILGRRDSGFVEAREGVLPGDEIVTRGSHQLSGLYVSGSISLSPEARRAVGLKVEEIDFRPIDRVVRLPATLLPAPGRIAAATPRIEGKVGGIHAVEGTRVRPGDPLAEITSLELERKQLDLIQGALRRGLLEKQLDVLKRLAERGIPSRKELASLSSEYQSQVARVQTAARELVAMGIPESLQEQIVRTRTPIKSVPISAPIGGIVIKVDAVPGRVVRPGEILFEILDPSVLAVEAPLFEYDLARLDGLKPGDPVQIRALDGGEMGSSTIESVSPRLEGAERTATMWMTLASPAPAALPGLWVQVVAVTEKGSEPVIAAPLRGLLSVSGRRYAFVERKKKFVRVLVETGREDANYAEVVRGLFPGDNIAVTGLVELNRAHGAIR